MNARLPLTTWPHRYSNEHDFVRKEARAANATSNPTPTTLAKYGLTDVTLKAG